MLDLVLLFIAVVIIMALLVVSHLRIVPESEAWVMERFGVYSRTWHTGLHLKVPFVERSREKVELREQILVVGEGYNHNHYHNHERDNYMYGRDKSSDWSSNNAGGAVAAGAGVSVGGLFTPQYSAGVGTVAGASSEHSSRIASKTKINLWGYHSNGHHAPTSQPVITKDNVSMDVDTVVFYQITDPKLFVYGHKTPIAAIEHLASTTLRNLIGELELDETLTSRDVINTKLRKVLDDATDSWGIKITRVEIRNIIVSDRDLAEAMEKQMIAERERRARVIEAEGIRKREILIAEGDKQSAILRAEGQKQARILAAEAQREADICEGEGEAEKIMLVEQAKAEGVKMNEAAKAEGIKLINAADASQETLTVKSLEALSDVGAGASNTILIPSEIQGLAGLAKSAAEVIKANPKA